MSNSNGRTSAARRALVVAHPGHELRIFGWLATMRPIVCVFSDGSGRAREARLASTTRLLESVGARRGPVYGRMFDEEIYSAILAHEHERFLGIAEELAVAFVAEGVDLVAADAVEGYNPCHDLCRYVVNAAVRLAAGMSGRVIRTFDFSLIAAPNVCPEHATDRAVWVHLDDALLARKLDAVRGYGELPREVEVALARFGTASFRTECLRPVDLEDPYGLDSTAVPFYESYGEQRVASGAYDRVLRFHDHVRPLADALWSHRGAGV